MSTPTTTRSGEIAAAADSVVQSATSSERRVPGVVAGLTNKKETFYLGASGVRDLGTGVPMTTDSVMAIFSTTKAITGTTALQLVEEGKLDLDAPAKEYAPAIGEIQVLDGFDDAGNPVLRAPRSDITTKQLLLHTAGFGYDFFNEQYNRLATDHGSPASSRQPSGTDEPAAIRPGHRMGVRQQHRLGRSGRRGHHRQIARRCHAGADLRPARHDRFGVPADRGDPPPPGHHAPTVSRRQPDADRVRPPGARSPHGRPRTSLDGARLPEIHPDVAEPGASDSGEQILHPDTVDMAVQNQLGDLKIKMLPGVIPSLSNDAEFFPGQPKSWALTFMVNDEEAPTGRPAGSIAWAGLANLYYWIDIRNGIGGYWGTQILPFVDALSVGGYLEFETATYRALQG